MMKIKNIMGMDQFGNIYHSLGKYPRKELLNRLGYKNAQRFYRDKEDGSTVCIGYVVGRLWVSLYEVKPFEQPA